jgi:hypothetical protein
MICDRVLWTLSPIVKICRISLLKEPLDAVLLNHYSDTVSTL